MSIVDRLPDDGKPIPLPVDNRDPGNLVKPAAQSVGPGWEAFPLLCQNRNCHNKLAQSSSADMCPWFPVSWEPCNLDKPAAYAKHIRYICCWCREADLGAEIESLNRELDYFRSSIRYLSHSKKMVYRAKPLHESTSMWRWPAAPVEFDLNSLD